MDFVKKHYEKLVLSVVLLGLAGAAAYLPFKVSAEKDKMQARKDELLPPSVKPMPRVNLTTNEAVIQRLTQPVHFKLEGNHNLFNPVRWQQKPDGGLIKVQTGRETGAGALVITRIEPLKLIITFDDVVGSNDNVRYKVSVTKQTDKNARPSSRTISKGTKIKDLFTVLDVKGPPEAPTEILLRLDGDEEPISLSKEMPFNKILGYSADLRYEGKDEQMSKKGLRVKDTLTLANEAYNIVAITQREVVLSASSNAKQTTIRANASASAPPAK